MTVPVGKCLELIGARIPVGSQHPSGQQTSACVDQSAYNEDAEAIMKHEDAGRCESDEAPQEPTPPPELFPPTDIVSGIHTGRLHRPGLLPDLILPLPDCLGPGSSG